VVRTAELVSYSGDGFDVRTNPATSTRAGDRIELGVDTRNLHFFDPESGLAIERTK